MNKWEEIITSEMRRKIRNDVLPEAIRFTDAVFPYLKEYDVDKLDRIIVEDIVMADEASALFTLEYDPWLNVCNAKCSFFALSANCDMPSVSNDDVLTAMRKALIDNKYQDSEISYYETDECDDEPLKRTKWTVKTDCSPKDDLYTCFMQIYNETLCAIEMMYEAYKVYAIKADLVGSYLKLMGITNGERELFDIELTASVFSCGKLMSEYDSHLVDGFCSLRRIFQPVGSDITSTEVSVEVIKAKNPSVFIASETLLEEESECDDFKYRQSFSVMEPVGASRSILHAKDVVARLYYISPDIYVLEPLKIFFEDDNTKYLIATRETDESFHFFTDKKDEIALVEKNDDNYYATIKFGLKELAPFIVAIDALIFEPNQKQDCNKAYDEDIRFRRMNGQIDTAKEKMKGWFKGDDYLDIFRDPAANLFSYIKCENYCEGKLIEKITYDEVFFVQDIKNRSFGIEADEYSDRYDINGLKGKQMRISDF